MRHTVATHVVTALVLGLVAVTFTPALHAAPSHAGAVTCDKVTAMPGAFPAPVGPIGTTCAATVYAPSGSGSLEFVSTVLHWELLIVGVYERVGTDASNRPVFADAPVWSCVAVRELNESLSKCDAMLTVAPGATLLVKADVDEWAAGAWGWAWAWP